MPNLAIIIIFCSLKLTSVFNLTDAFERPSHVIGFNKFKQLSKQRTLLASDASLGITYNLYTRQNPTIPEVLKENDTNSLKSPTSNYDPAKHNFIYCHGWQSNVTDAPSRSLINAVLNSENVNLFLVNWDYISSQNYFSARMEVENVGKAIAEFINNMQRDFLLLGDKFTLIGMSLGAHCMGIAGSNAINRISVIIGLDAALPLFEFEGTAGRLDPTDADFVMAIHTSSGGLGYANPYGTVDLYPNGGKVQRGCGYDPTTSCAHKRSFFYYVESVTRGAVFLAVQCSSYDEFEKSACNSNAVEAMGTLWPNTASKGGFYLDTRSQSLYGTGTVGPVLNQ